jgi:hypothetical protein
MLQRKAFQGIAPQHSPNRASSARCLVAKASVSQTQAASQSGIVQETQSGTAGTVFSSSGHKMTATEYSDKPSVLADLKAGRREAVGLALAAAFAGEPFCSTAK